MLRQTGSGRRCFRHANGLDPYGCPRHIRQWDRWSPFFLLALFSDFADRRKIKIRNISQQRCGITDRDSERHAFRHNAGGVRKFRGENPDDFTLPIEDRPPLLPDSPPRPLETPVAHPRTHSSHMASGDGGFAQPELKPNGNHLLIQLHGPGRTQRRFGQPDGFYLQKREVMLASH